MIDDDEMIFVCDGGSAFRDWLPDWRSIARLRRFVSSAMCSEALACLVIDIQLGDMSGMELMWRNSQTWGLHFLPFS